MCEILIKATNSSHVDPEEDKKHWKRGDIVVIQEDGHEWGNLETLPHFIKVRIQNVPVDTARAYVAEHLDDLGVRESRSLFRLLVDAQTLPQWVKDSLRDTGMVTVTWNQIRTYIQNKKTGETQ